MRARFKAAGVALIALAVSGCFGRSAAPPAGEIIRLACPDRLVTFDKAKRPTPPEWGRDDLADAARYEVDAEKYMDERDRQAAARVEQVEKCHARMKSAG